MKKALALFLDCSTECYAANTPTAFVEVDGLRVSEQTGVAYVDPGDAVENLNDSCSHKDLYALNTGDTNFNAMLSILLAAGAAKKEVKLWISIDSGDCLNGRQKVQVVEVKF